MKRSSNKKPLYNNVYFRYNELKKPPNHSSYSSELTGDLLMYRYTFASRVTLVAALLLCISLLLQPVAHVYADEITSAPAEEPVITDPVDAAEGAGLSDTEADMEDDTTGSTEEPVAMSEAALVVEAEMETDEATQIESDVVTVEATEPADTSESTPTDTTGSSTDEDLVTDTASTTPDSDTNETVTETDTEGDNTDAATSTEHDLDESESSNETSFEAEEFELATTTVEETVAAVTTVQSDQAINFNKNECTEVSDGSFYCQKSSLENDSNDALFAAPDNTGDMEIYVVQDGIELQVTNNLLEDSSPYFDSLSNTLVWQRLINDRYQIISYDIDSGTETQLTATRVNNMEPSRHGDYTVWQRWVTNNWEIMLFDGIDEIQLTDSVRHDIAPHIHGDMIIWNVRSSDGTQSLMTYDISSRSFNEINDTEGVSVINPRMLVMYEAQYQNGDSVMKGFDLVTGEIIPIERLPRDLPTDIPDPDATGEVRALPSTSPNEEKLTASTTEPEPTDPPEPAVDPVTASTTAPTPVFELDLRGTDDMTGTTTDLVVEQAAIPDVVIPTFDETTIAGETATSTQDT